MFDEPDMPPRRRTNLSEQDLAAIKQLFDERHPCSNFTEEEITAMREVARLLTPANIQAVSEIITVFRDGKQTIWGVIKLLMFLCGVFFLWAMYKTGFLLEKVVK